MADIDLARRYLSATFLSNPGVTLIGVGEKIVDGKPTGRTAVVVGVERKLPLSALLPEEVVPTAVVGVETDVVETGLIRALADPSRYRPSPAGVSFGHYLITAGTLGAWVKKNDEWYALTNNHVAANENNALVGDPILQPGSYDGGTVKDDTLARLTTWIPLTKSGVNRVDAAIAKPINASDVSPLILEIGEVKGARAAKFSETVRKRGRTTGLKTGTVTLLNVTVKVQYDMGVLTFEEQIVIGTPGFSAGGDSGSLIVALDGAAVGLLFAGSEQITIANNIIEVIAALGVQFVTGEPTPPPPPPPPPPPDPKNSPFCAGLRALKVGLRASRRAYRVARR